jgi:glycosyltransferase involved in cell wall biosynthesis
MPEKITVCIIAGNEERNIRRCLESAKWANEIVVLDSFSKDRTVEICHEYTDRVYQHEWMGYIGQKNLIKDMATGPWIFFLDADEEISPALRAEIETEFSSGNAGDFAGYEFPRLVWYLGRWIYHGDWYPDTKLRLFRKDRGKCGGQEPHDRIYVDGRVKQLKNPLFHYTYTDISNQLATMNRFTTITAIGKQKNGRIFRLSDVTIRPVLRFLRCYILKRGFLDGIPGLVIATFTALSVFSKYAKLWEIQINGKNGQQPQD